MVNWFLSNEGVPEAKIATQTHVRESLAAIEKRSLLSKHSNKGCLGKTYLVEESWIDRFDLCPVVCNLRVPYLSKTAAECLQPQNPSALSSWLM